MKKICLYHDDLDGHCSGAIYKLAHKDEDVILHPINYGCPIPWDLLVDAEVTIVDFSLQPWHEFHRLFREARKVIWIDHHKSAIDLWNDAPISETGYNVETVLDSDFAACELTWKYYFLEVDIPVGVYYLGRYDVWDHDINPRIVPFQYGMRLMDLDPKNDDENTKWVWETLLEHQDHNHDAVTFIRDTIDAGEIVLRYQRNLDKELANEVWFAVELDGMTWQAANRLGRGSMFFNSIWNPSMFHGMLSFYFDGVKWQLGLYTDRDDVDCGAVAAKFGGGGHKKAAGCQCKKLPFQLRK